MLEIAALVAVGVALGTYAVAIGVSGAFVLTPLLLLRHPAAGPEFVTVASFGVVGLSSALTSVVSTRRRRIDWPVAAMLAGSTLPGGLLGARFTEQVPRGAFDLGVAVLLLLLAVYLAWRPAASIADPLARGWRRQLQDREGNVFVYRIRVLGGVGSAAAASFVAALSGIGGGVFFVPLGTRVMRLPHALAVPAAHVAITALSLTVVSFHLVAGHVGEPLHDAPWLALGMLASNPLGQRVHRRLGEGPLTRLLAAGILVIAVRTAWGAL